MREHSSFDSITDIQPIISAQSCFAEELLDWSPNKNSPVLVEVCDYHIKNVIGLWSEKRRQIMSAISRRRTPIIRSSPSSVRMNSLTIMVDEETNLPIILRNTLPGTKGKFADLAVFDEGQVATFVSAPQPNQGNRYLLSHASAADPLRPLVSLYIATSTSENGTALVEVKSDIMLPINRDANSQTSHAFYVWGEQALSDHQSEPASLITG